MLSPFDSERNREHRGSTALVVPRPNCKCEWLQAVYSPPTCLSPSKKAPGPCNSSGLNWIRLSNPEPSCCRLPRLLSPGCNEQPIAGHSRPQWLSLQSCALSQACAKPQSLPWVQGEWPWFLMLMASHRQRVSFGSSRYSSGPSAWFILRSTWNEI